MIRDFYNPENCQIKWEESYLNGFRNQPSAAMLDGLVFEHNRMIRDVIRSDSYCEGCLASFCSKWEHTESTHQLAKTTLPRNT